uniref:Uncharacterized protein n=1 Tax=Globodera rostochiensis TaxID=31243 RepID=A0A914I8N8_GLORO
MFVLLPSRGQFRSPPQSDRVQPLRAAYSTEGWWVPMPYCRAECHPPTLRHLQSSTIPQQLTTLRIRLSIPSNVFWKTNQQQ